MLQLVKSDYPIRLSDMLNTLRAYFIFGKIENDSPESLGQVRSA